MTFDEWFEQEFWQIGDFESTLAEERFVEQMRRAWEASRENLRSWDI